MNHVPVCLSGGTCGPLTITCPLVDLLPYVPLFATVTPKVFVITIGIVFGYLF